MEQGSLCESQYASTRFTGILICFIYVHLFSLFTIFFSIAGTINSIADAGYNTAW